MKAQFVDDLLRDQFWQAKEFFYDLIREPIFQATGSHPGLSLRQRGVLQDVVDGGARDRNSLWIDNYEQLTPSVARALEQGIDPDALAIGYEMSPGLIYFLSARGIQWVDFRISPIRFLPDLLIALRTSSPRLHASLAKAAVKAGEVRIEARKWIASFRHIERSQRKGALPTKAAIYFVGQSGSDASLIRGSEMLRALDYRAELAEVLEGMEVIYLPHPTASEGHMRSEEHTLRDFAQSVSVSRASLYETFCSEAPAEYIGISSGSLQEAEFFERKARLLHQPICPILFPDRDDAHVDGYWQFPFQLFSRPEFFEVLFQKRSMVAPVPLDQTRRDELRQLHDVWWGYADFASRPNGMTRALQRRLSERVDQVEARVAGCAELLLEEPDYQSSVYAKLYRRVFLWVDGSQLRFTDQGDCIRNGRVAGRWRVRGSHAAQRELVLIWSQGGWVDKAMGAADWSRLDCVNNLGDRFQVSALP
jgi:hypothetical protein